MKYLTICLWFYPIGRSYNILITDELGGVFYSDFVHSEFALIAVVEKLFNYYKTTSYKLSFEE